MIYYYTSFSIITNTSSAFSWLKWKHLRSAQRNFKECNDPKKSHFNLFIRLTKLLLLHFCWFSYYVRFLDSFLMKYILIYLAKFCLKLRNKGTILRIKANKGRHLHSCANYVIIILFAFLKQTWFKSQKTRNCGHFLSNLEN